jgi:dihydrofolate reductase
MPPSSSPGKILTLIVATTPVTRHASSSPLLGIGLNGTLPWPRIKSDMAFFARITTRPPLSTSTAAGESKVNAIIMGRKTYYSLPKSLRPLKERVNVVISRDESGGVAEEVARDLARQKEKNSTAATNNGEIVQDKRDAFVANSLEAAIEQLQKRGGTGHVYVIGGGEIYNSALKLSSSLSEGERVVLRILMTRVKKVNNEEFECDTFFPLADEDLSASWREAGPEELGGWVGERVLGDGEWVEEGEVAIKIEGYERVV